MDKIESAGRDVDADIRAKSDEKRTDRLKAFTAAQFASLDELLAAAREL